LWRVEITSALMAPAAALLVRRFRMFERAADRLIIGSGERGFARHQLGTTHGGFFLYAESVKSRVFGTVISRGVSIFSSSNRVANR